MKDFIRTRSYDIVRMLLDQFATAIFGAVLALASVRAQNPTLRNITSVFAILFYLFLLYTMMWEIGFKDKTAVDAGRKSKAPLTGFLMSLCANIPNFVFALFITLAFFLDAKLLSTLGAFSATAALLLEGMYTGVLANHVMGVALHDHWWIYFVITIPSMITCTVSYILGTKDIKFTSLFNAVYPESDREPKKHKKEK